MAAFEAFVPTRPKGSSLRDLLALLAEAGGEGTGNLDTRVFGVAQDSRRVEPGDLFIARAGQTTDGAKFIEDAILRGATAVLADRPLLVSVPSIRTSDVRRAVGPLAHAVYEFPARSLQVVGLTGTNGKTTTSYLVRAALDAGRGEVTGLIGTVGHRFRDLAFVATHTTPEADELARLLRAMRQRGAEFAAMEVSSIALEQERTRGIEFAVAAFTNLTQDHLDFHGTMDAYRRAKWRLFLEYAPKHSVVCVDSPAGEELARVASGNVLRVSAESGHGADLFPANVSISADGIRAELETPCGRVPLRSPLSGKHNLENLVVTLGVACVLGRDLRGVAEALAHEPGAPGRLERASTASDDIHVFVDYAHTPDALVRVLESLRPLTAGRLTCVFGCGGDRDPTKRAPMGEAVARAADIAVITNDNPRSEAPDKIAEPIVRAVSDAGLADIGSSLGDAQRGYVVILDRHRAIEAAVLSARAGDTVLLAGKGHETYQIIGTETLGFDDRIEARRALEKRLQNGKRA